jgi:repressor LexA
VNSADVRSSRPCSRRGERPTRIEESHAAHQAPARDPDVPRQLLDRNGYAPSFEEIAETFNYNSLATVHEHLSNLERKGYIKRSYNESRAIQILPSDCFARAVELPMLGTVAAGVPIEAVAAGETLAVPEAFLRKSGTTTC